MAEYIEREAFIKLVEETYCKPCEEAKRDYNHCRCGSCQYDDMMRDAESFYAADVAPVRHGRWISDKKRLWYKCSNCGMKDMLEQDYSFCPFCGAKMDKEE